MNDTTAVTRNERGHAPMPRARRRRTAQRPALIPPVDVIEDSTGITLRADLPGVAKDKLTLHVESDTLTIEGEVDLRCRRAWRRATPRSACRGSGAYSRCPRSSIPARYRAELKHGVLSLRIPKAEHAQPRRIDIKVS
jgi:HSP20 family molecular chaperone IbpA